MNLKTTWVFAIPAALWLGVSGCAPSAETPADATPAHVAGDGHDPADHSHGGWWCAEHGVPEEVCAQCNSKLAAEFQRKGDWCAEHGRPDSQCFACHPDRAARFAAQYQAKYGEQPPQPAG
jgi:cobalt-zinc-cadmium efflux system membrane fusion protein